jgi:hypothetical protein
LAKVAARAFAWLRPFPVTTSKILIGCSVLLLSVSALFGILNAKKTAQLRTDAVQSELGRKEAEQARLTYQQELKSREAALNAPGATTGDSKSKVAQAEAELMKSRREKENLQAKLSANAAEIAELRKRIEESGSKRAAADSPSAASVEMRAQLDDMKKQLDAAEREKALLSEQVTEAQKRSAQSEPEKKRLAVNQAYNFVVLNLGGRQGVEANTEMLVLRGGTLIGKIRVSSVEPATAIGDIITNSLARGVQVQPGDTVVYAGSNS